MRLLMLSCAAGLFAFSTAGVQAGTVLVNHGDDRPFVGEGETLTVYGPHHFSPTPPHAPFPHPPTEGGTHYFAETGDAHHFAWFSATPATPGTVTVKYDFRAQGGFPNMITAAQKSNAVAALAAWSAGTGGKLLFVQDTVGPASGLVNIGTGDLAALGSTSGPGGTLGLGGGSFGHGPSTHLIAGGVAWQDFAETWDTTIGNGNPAGTIDYFTVAVQETGHALGLGHTDNEGGTNMMNGFYLSEQTALSAVDVSHIQSVYGMVPEPSSLTLLGTGSLLGLICYRRRKRRQRAAAA